MTFRRSLAVLVPLAAVLGLACWLQFGSTPTAPRQSTVTEPSTAATAEPVAVATNAPAAAATAVPAVGTHAKRVVTGEVKDGLSEADRKLYEAVETAWDSDDLPAVRKAVEAAVRSADPEVRLEAIDALAWYGEKTLPELTPLMGDSNADVREAAISAWESALDEVESPMARLRIAAKALRAISEPAALETIGDAFTDAAGELIDGEEDEAKAQRNRVMAIQALTDLMGEGATAARTEAAKSIYEGITGNEWISVEEAERYLKDPDAYEPPEQ